MTEPQHMQALRRANEARIAGAAVRHEVADGSLAIVDALEDERAASQEVIRLLMALRYISRVRAAAILEELGIPENKRAGTLTDRQRRVIAEACPAWTRKAAA